MNSADTAAGQREALRQQALLRLLWRCEVDPVATPGPVGSADLTGSSGWWRESPARVASALGAYRANGQALAARALAAAFATVAELIGHESFATLAAAHWHRHPPARGDIGQWGAELPRSIAEDAQLAELPYLADCARLDWAVHRIESAADHGGAAAGLERLASADPATLGLRFRPGLALLCTAWPVAAIWQAHRSQAPEQFGAAREALAQGRHDNVLVWRDGWRAQVSTLDASAAQFTQAALDGHPLAEALDLAGPGFAFEPWLLQALRERWLAAVTRTTPDAQPAPD